MRARHFVAALVLIVAVAGTGWAQVTEPAAVYFSPGGGCTKAIVKALSSAKHEVLVQAYYFTSATIAKALLEAQRRGVGVRVILDRSQVRSGACPARSLSNLGIPVWIDSAEKIAHNKVLVIDSARVITGSFNFTKAAEASNAENVAIITDARVAAIYAKNWREHLVHSKPYTQKDAAVTVAAQPGMAASPAPLRELEQAPDRPGSEAGEPSPAPPAVGTPSIRTLFGPSGGGTQAIASAIEGARKRVLIATDALTSKAIGDAVVGAINRGLEVRVVFDPGSKMENRAAKFFARIGDIAWVDGEHAKLGANFMVVDDSLTVISAAAFTKMAEAAGGGFTTLVSGGSTAADFAKNWETHRSHATRQRSDGRPPPRQGETEGHLAGPQTKFWLIQAGLELWIVEVSELCDGDEPMDIVRAHVDQHVIPEIKGIADTLEAIKEQAARAMRYQRQLVLKPGVY